jgi:tyrosinase
VELLSDQDVAQLRLAIQRVVDINDDRGFGHWGGIHGLPLPGFCQHHNPKFLMWHRAYLYFFELALEDQTPGITLPWWDWTSDGSRTNGIPDAYALPTLPDGTDNRLFSAPVTVPAGTSEQLGEIPAVTFREPGNPAELPTPEDIEDILNAPNFIDFTTRLENVHDNIHVWVGGTMSEVPLAAFDPIFWAHHCMIDRLWWLWQLRHPGGNPPVSADEALAPFSMNVGQTHDINLLGYEYALAETVIPPAGG